MTKLVNGDGESYAVTAEEMPAEQGPVTEPDGWPTLRLVIGRGDSQVTQAAAD